jgi:predicted alpha/beta-hydrolase family hydrolase
VAPDASAEVLRFRATERSGEVSALLLRPADAERLLVFAHGAGAGMQHRFMEAVADRLAQRRIGTLRFQFPYMEQGRRSPDRPPVATATVRSAVLAANEHAGDLALFAGGKSFGGRMTSTAAAEDSLPGVRGIVFFGFPLHAPGKPSSSRGDHLREVEVPMLFLQGTRDKLAELSLLSPLCEGLGDAATLHRVDGGDHSFHVLKRSGRTDEAALDELAEAVDAWTSALACR